MSTMVDVTIFAHHHDQLEAIALDGLLRDRGLSTGPRVEMFPGMHIPRFLRATLHHSQFVAFLVSPSLLKLALDTRDLDALATNPRVVAILEGADPRRVAERSQRLAEALVDDGEEAVVRLARGDSHYG
jgi:hypothetical protein